jgi:hypothetical protein
MGYILDIYYVHMEYGVGSNRISLEKLGFYGCQSYVLFVHLPCNHASQLLLTLLHSHEEHTPVKCSQRITPNATPFHASTFYN